MRGGFGDVLKNPLVIGLLATHVAKNLVDSYGQAKQNAMMPDPTEEAAKQQALAEGRVITEMPNTGLFHRILGVGPDMTPLSQKAIAGEKIALHGQGEEELGNLGKFAEIGRYMGAPNYNAMMAGPTGEFLRARGVAVPANMPFSTPAEEIVQLREQRNQDIAAQNLALNQIRQQQADDRARLYEAQINKLESGGAGADETLHTSRIINAAGRMLFNMDPLGMKYAKYQPIAEQMLEANIPPSQVSQRIIELEQQAQEKANAPSWTFRGALEGVKNMFGGGPSSTSAGTTAPSGATGGWYGPTGAPSSSATAPW